MGRLELMNLYNEFTRDELIEIYTELTEPVLPDPGASQESSTGEDLSMQGPVDANMDLSDSDENLSPEVIEKDKKKALIVNGGAETLLRYLLGELPSQDHYFRILYRM